MKYKKILLFILILFFILIIHNTSNAFVVSEGGNYKYSLPNLPFDDEDRNIIMFFNENKLQVYLFEFFNDSYVGFDRINNCFRIYDTNKKLFTDDYDLLLGVYYCNVSLINGVYTSGSNSWHYISHSGTSYINLYTINSITDYSDMKSIYSTTTLFPCYEDILISSLPKDYTFKEDLIVCYDKNDYDHKIVCFRPESYFSGFVWANKSGGSFYLCYRESYNSGESNSLLAYIYNTDICEWEFSGNIKGTSSYGSYSMTTDDVIFCNSNILDFKSGNTTTKSMKNLFCGSYTYSVFPYILNSAADLSKGNDDIVIMPGDFTNIEDINFVIQKIETKGEGDETYESYTNIFDTITLNVDSDYYTAVGNEGFFYVIPWSFIESKLEKDVRYSYVLSYSYNDKTYTKDLFSTYGGLSEFDIIHNKINEETKVFEEYYKRQEVLIQEQTKLQEEQNETSKGIWGTLKEVLSYINPFSENFFVYKLIDLLIDALKSLFIPDNDFLTNYFNELMDWFSDRLGFLFYPLELILDVLDRIISINFEEPIIQIPDFIEPSTNEKIINSTTYNLNSLLENDIFKTCHNVYLILVDAVIVFGLVNLLKHKLEEVFTK